MASDMTKLKRQLYLSLPFLIWKHSDCAIGDQVQKAIRGWLSPPDPWKNHHIALDSRHEATAAWFIQGETFLEWKSSGSSSLLWIHGKRQSLLSFCVFAETDEYHTL